jgi:hypothetical protein
VTVLLNRALPIFDVRNHSFLRNEKKKKIRHSFFIS